MELESKDTMDTLMKLDDVKTKMELGMQSQL
jgi:hypothetical protein